MTKENLGKFIAENRKALGMTQEELAQKLFVTNKAVSKWEKGLSFPDIAMFEPLAEALGVSVAELFSGEKEEKDVSVKAVLELSGAVIRKEKKKLHTAVGILFSVIIALLIIFSESIADAIDARNMDYLYWKGFYYVPTNEGVPANWLEPIGTVRKAGIRNEENYGGDSNIADPETEIYVIVPPEDAEWREYADYEDTLAARVDGKLTLFRFTFWGRQDFERYERVNIKEGEWGKGYLKTEDFY
ncbi:MAG: helix-turn-helix domain-containing protein [Oscillospiraceae bacterium]|nr:helix-turn-helix domain-containing protein [Oscillospiraceae bacterium]